MVRPVATANTRRLVATGDRRARGDNELGQVVPIMAGIIVVLAVIGLGLARFGALMIDRARAQNAADAAALGAARTIDPHDRSTVAARLATRNGASLVRVSEVGPIVVVEVVRDKRRAVAAARPVADPSSNDP